MTQAGSSIELIRLLSRLQIWRAVVPILSLAAVGSNVQGQRPGSGDDAKPPLPQQPRRHIGIPNRVPWATSRVTGTPDPPLPYKLERAFPKLTFKNPLLLVPIPGATRWVVGENAGKLLSFPNDDAVSKADLFLDLTTEIHSWDPKGRVKDVAAVYGLVFHPQFARNRFCYVCYVLNSKTGEALPDGSRVSRFRVTDTSPPRCDPASEQILITWLAGGHNGGDLHFGPDGYFYISTGDGADPNPPDRFDTGQDLSDVLSSVLRIDVDHTDAGKAYSIPVDNPFVKMPGARPEIWAYGFRNPWRMSFDRATGDLWVGDVGWELWEMVYRVRKGGNYGWSVMEGRQPVRPESKRGPTPILPPTLDFPHSEAASITGGYVYRGKRLKELVGAYLCGDWMTRKVWATRFDGDRIVWHKEIASGTGRIVAFGQDEDGEQLIVFYDEAGSIQRLMPNPAALVPQAKFPTRLSETGLFTSTKNLNAAPGVIPYSINAPMWADHATAERLVALPGTSTIKIYDHPVPVPGTAFYTAKVFFPKDAVLAKTFVMEMERGNPQSRRRLETQLLHFDGSDWHGYSYAWSDDQTDAILVPAAGANRALEIPDREAPGGKRKQTWHFPARAECVQCHNPWAGTTLSFTQPQIDREHDDGGARVSQLAALARMGVIEFAKDAASSASSPVAALAEPQNPAAKIDARARAYLHVNCSHCHQFGAGGTADMDLRYDTPLAQTKVLGVRPTQGTFAIHGAHIVSPSDPFRSVVFYRMAKLGPGRMPHIGSEIVDEAGLRLIHDWIRELKGTETTARPSDTDAMTAVLVPANGGGPYVDKKRLEHLLGSTSGALRLAYRMGVDPVVPTAQRQILDVTRSHSDAQVRDLFERYLPYDERVKRLGTAIRPEQILALKGDAGRGRDLFFKSAGLQCISCHRIAGQGSTLGPDLSAIGKKYGRGQILESILEPSKSVDPAYVMYLAETKDGQVYTGLLGQKTAEWVVLKAVGDKEVRLPAAEVQTLVPQKNSLMPELLLRDLTIQQAADLVDFLAGLK
jgi:putative heme-binding domain-containing protein